MIWTFIFGASPAHSLCGKTKKPTSIKKVNKTVRFAAKLQGHDGCILLPDTRTEPPGTPASRVSYSVVKHPGGSLLEWCTPLLRALQFLQLEIRWAIITETGIHREWAREGLPMSDVTFTTAGLAAAGWLWDKYGKDIVDKASEGLAKRWLKVKWPEAEARYRSRMKELHGYTRLLGNPKRIEIEEIYTDVYVLDKPTAFHRFDLEELHSRPIE